MGTDPWSEVKPTMRGRFGNWLRRWQQRRAQREHDWVYGPQQQQPVALQLRQPPAPPPYPTVQFTAVLPSRVPHAEFQATITVAWEVTAGTEAVHAKPESVARREIERRAAEITATALVLHSEQVQHRIEAELGVLTRVEGSQVSVQVREVELAVPEESRAATELYQEVQRRKLARGWERDLHIEELRHLKDDILSDPAMATVWWLHNNGNQVDQALEMSTKLRRLAEVLADQPEQSNPDTVMSLVDRFVDRLPEGARWRLLSNLAEVFSHYGSPDLASELPQLRPAERGGQEPA
ncbi:hypothetical protein [Kutzneria albida]|uniref:Uncharacterized protein n=1 Tax=Kutzneria albida DSM 43870 TaxID=1449976 RepID=W5VZZ4_9PSEU|nr:hypothetical protein [Kutzneria albida]AHH94080.1 hypothetical protein KALB_705 [Kutzneria albida DSM 43870]